MSHNKVIIKLHHVSFIVEDLQIALAFYQNILGLEIDRSRPDLGYPGAWLKLPGEQQIHLMQLPDPDALSERPEHGGRDRHAAFLVNSIEEISHKLDNIKTAYTKSRSGRKAMFCRDPDGNALEFIEGQ